MAYILNTLNISVSNQPKTLICLSFVLVIFCCCDKISKINRIKYGKTYFDSHLQRSQSLWADSCLRDSGEAEHLGWGGMVNYTTTSWQLGNRQNKKKVCRQDTYFIAIHSYPSHSDLLSPTMVTRMWYHQWINLLPWSNHYLILPPWTLWGNMSYSSCNMLCELLWDFSFFCLNLPFFFMSQSHVDHISNIQCWPYTISLFWYRVMFPKSFIVQHFIKFFTLKIIFYCMTWICFIYYFKIWCLSSIRTEIGAFLNKQLPSYIDTLYS